MDNDIVPENQAGWLWPGHFPLGAVSLIVGEPGIGKSLLTMDMAARVSRGGAWPDSPRDADLGSVALLATEDSIERTIVPRLQAAGAELGRIRIVGIGQKAVDRGYMLDLIEGVVMVGGVRLLVIDPLSAFLGPRTDRFDIRAAMFDLFEMARRTQTAVVVVAGTTPHSGTDHLSKGSMAFIAAVRSAWIIDRDGSDPGRRLLRAVKSSTALLPPPLAFRIADNAVRWEPALVHAA